ncbi:hypothetical protein RYX36_032045 [Vicia faba]
MSPSVPNGVSVGGVGAISNVQMNEDPRKSFQSLNLTMSPSVPNGVSVGGVGAISNVQMNEDPRKRPKPRNPPSELVVPTWTIITMVLFGTTSQDTPRS